jgi:flagellar biosynthesis chaperone FliJ
MLDDDALTRLLGEAAESFPAPGFPALDEAARPHRYGKWVRWSAVAAALVVGVLVVQSVTGGSSPSTRTTAGGSAASLPAHGPADLTNGQEAPVAAPQKDATTFTSGSGTSGGASAGVAAGPLAPTAQVPAGLTARTPAFTPGNNAAGTTADAFQDSAKIVKTGSVALIVPDGKVSPVVDDITRKLKGQGGYIASSKSQEYGDSPSSSLTIRMPVGNFESVVDLVRREGKVDSSSLSGQDVTAQYTDVSAQIRSLAAARSRFLLILSRANTIGETLSVQQQVDNVQQQIDQLTGRLRVLQNQTSMGTLTVTVSEKAKAVAVHEQSGLSRAWHNAKHGFTSGVEALVSKSGRGLLVLLVAAVCLVLARFGWRFARRRMV